MSMEKDRLSVTFARLNDDQTEVIPCSWFKKYPVVRIGALADNNCFLHSVCKAYNPEYQTNADISFRMSYVQKLRYALAEALTLEDPEDEKGRTFYETVGNGELYKLGKSYTMNIGRKEEIEDFSLKGIKSLLEGTSFLGDEIYALVGQVLGIDIYIVRSNKYDIYKHIDFIYNKRDQMGIVIHGDGIHYETIGVRTPKGIQTIFYKDDPFLKALTTKAKGLNKN